MAVVDVTSGSYGQALDASLISTAGLKPPESHFSFECLEAVAKLITLRFSPPGDSGKERAGGNKRMNENASLVSS